MPTYEYLCNACGNRFEKFQSISAAPIKTCVVCGKNKAQRQISGGAGFIFKGGGFYETDYRSEGYKKAAEADKPSDAAKNGESKSTDTKPTESKSAETTAAAPAKSEPAPAAPAAAAKPAKKSGKAKS